MATMDYPTLRRMFNDRDKMVRVFCLKVAVRDNLPELDEFLREGLGDDRPEVIRAALAGVRAARDPAVVRATLALLDSANPSLRLLALQALTGRGSVEIGAALGRYVRNESDPNLLSAALQLIGTLHDDTFLPLLKAFLTFEDDRVRANAVDAMALLDNIEVVEILKALVGDRNNRVRANAIRGLWGKGIRFGLNTLPEELRSPNPKKRASVAYILGEIKEERSAELLLKLLGDPTPMVRNRAVLSLGRLGSPRLIGPLLNIYVKEEDSGIRQVIIDTCLGLSVEQCLAELTTRFEQEADPRLRAGLLSHLQHCQRPAMLPLLLKAIRDPDSRVRANAVEALGAQGDAALAEVILPLLNDSHNRVRSNAAMALWKLGGTLSILTIKQMLRSAHKAMRASAAYALGEIGALQFAELLQDMANDQDPDVRKCAIKALAKIRKIS